MHRDTLAGPVLDLDSCGPYRLCGLLGQGGMGEVYRAEHTRTQALVALKIVQVADEALLSFFRREIFALRSLDHPGVVRVIADGVSAGRPWYAMELCEGQTLADRIDQLHDFTPTDRPLAVVASGHTMANADTIAPPPPAPDKQAELAGLLSLVRALCSALAYVHGKGVVHRDLKPANIVLRESGVPVLLDFGLALQFGGGRTRDVLDVAGKALGTPAYMSPEQIRGALVDARADLYALGCVLYECATGRVPFEGPPSSVLTQHLTRAPAPPSAIGDVPAELESLILRLLEKDPRDRLGFAADVARALEEAGVADPPAFSAPAPSPYLYRPRLAGRSQILDRLAPRLDGQGERRHDLILLGGHSGIGKTRLAMELATAAARNGKLVVTGQCVDVSASSEQVVRAAPLHPFRSMLGAVADRCRALGYNETARLLGDRGRVLEPYEPILRELPGQRERPLPAVLPAEAARVRLLDTMAEVLAAFSAVQPTVLVLDDLQWADELSLALLHILDADYLAASDLLVIGTYRLEEQTDELGQLLGCDHAQCIELGALDREAVEQMVGDMLALRDPPEALCDFLLQESEGNPFFIAEYLRAAIVERLIRRGPSGVWAVQADRGDPESLRSALPVTGGMRELVRRRLADLDPAARALAQLAAVLGRELDGDLLLLAGAGPAPPSSRGQAVDSRRERGGRGALEQLRRRQILEETGAGKLRFVHDKLREVIYDDIAEAARPRLHLCAAEAMEARPSAHQHLEYPLLAHHYGVAGQVDKTLEYLEKAGEQALLSAASSDARRYFGRALELGAGRPGVDEARRARWLRRLGEACYNLGELPLAERHLRAALDRLAPERIERLPFASKLAPILPARSSLAVIEAVGGQLGRLAGIPPRRAQQAHERHRLHEASLAAERLSQTYFFLNQQDRAFAAALQTAHFAEQLGPSAELARGYAVLGVAFGYSPAKGLTTRYGAKAEAIAAEVGDPHAIAFVAFLRGLSSLGSAKHRDARAFLRRALDTAKQIGDVRASQEMRPVFAYSHTVAGLYADAMALVDELEESVRKNPNAQGELWVRTGRGSIYVAQGMGREALAQLALARAEAATTGDRTGDIMNGLAATAHMMVGEWDEARRIAEYTLGLIGDDLPTGYHVCLGHYACCDVALASWERATSRGDDTSRLQKLARRACDGMDRYARVFELGGACARMYRGHLWWLDGRRRHARRAWREAIDLAARHELPLEEGRSHYELGRHLPIGSHDRGVHLERAAAILGRIGTRYWLERVLAQTR